MCGSAWQIRCRVVQGVVLFDAAAVGILPYGEPRWRRVRLCLALLGIATFGIGKVG